MRLPSDVVMPEFEFESESESESEDAVWPRVVQRSNGNSSADNVPRQETTLELGRRLLPHGLFNRIFAHSLRTLGFLGTSQFLLGRSAVHPDTVTHQDSAPDLDSEWTDAQADYFRQVVGRCLSF